MTVWIYSMMYSPFPKPYHGGVLRQTLDVSRRARSRAFIAPSPALFDARVGRSAPIAFCFSFSNVFFTFSNNLKNGREIMEFKQSLCQSNKTSYLRNFIPLRSSESRVVTRRRAPREWCAAARNGYGMSCFAYRRVSRLESPCREL